MGLVQWGHLNAPPRPPIRVRFECEYSGEDYESDSATFIAGPELGSTPEQVHAAILRLMDEEFFEVPVLGAAPLEMCRETVRRLTVW